MHSSVAVGLSGLYANSVSLQAIGNNLANMNTVGYKASTTTFQDLMSKTLGFSGQNPSQLGQGVAPPTVSSTFSQGAIQTTQENVNVALQGKGFLVVDGPGGRAYTRAGDFSFDATGTLVNSSGLTVQGWSAIDAVTGEIITNGAAENIVVPMDALEEPVATTVIKTVTNLDAAAAVGDEFATVVEIFDALGAAHQLTVTFTNTAPGAWDYTATLPGDEVVGGVAGVPFEIDAGDVAFDDTGLLAFVGGAAAADVAQVTPAWANGAVANAWDWDLVGPDGAGNLTGFASASTTSSIERDGSEPGMTQRVNVDGDGNLVATLGSGETVNLAQLSIASFNNPKGLTKIGGNLYAANQATGVANLGTAGTNGRGSVVGGSLEQSNVDMALEFTRMILAQRGYQASSRTITASDEMLLETLNLKR